MVRGDPSDEGIDDTFVSTEARLTVPPRVSRTDQV